MSKDDHKLIEIYEKIADKTRELYVESSEKTLDTLEHALEKARHGVETAGDISRQESEKLKEYIRRDLEQAASRLETLSAQTKQQVEPRVKQVETGFLNLTYHLAHGASDVFGRLADWANTDIGYHTGQITSEGMLQCKACDKKMHFKQTGHIPPCPHCHKTEFRKIDED